MTSLHCLLPDRLALLVGPLQPESAPTEVPTAADFLFLVGTIAERGHKMTVDLATSCAARSSYREFVGIAERRGFTERRRLRAALRVGRITPRGQRLAQDVIGYFSADELAVMAERFCRFYRLTVNPSPENFSACRASPVFNVDRTVCVVAQRGGAT